MDTSKKTPEWNITAKEWQEEAVTDHNSCCLCGGELKFQHKVDHVKQFATEDATCGHCNVKHRSTMHTLQ